MGASTKERGVLKLVHPGRIVEYHTRSITAAEIMRKNPRHSITRPDFFENPHIVVNPESVMVPGQVFYIVPNKTIHRLVKARCQQFDRPSPQQYESPNTSDYKQASPSKALAGSTPKHQIGSSSCDDSLPDQAEETTQSSLVEYQTFQARDYYLNRNGSAMAITTNYDQQQKKSSNLKSCLKKVGSIPTSPKRRVSFNFSTMIQYI
ncbi:hypothetical protein Ccrd_003705 [Cynara cardunculus var. scolymus]|uniref:Uncharacterized protein n=1 Tax=Cynara cardunculus var. scolymus TaxID=59895 RepID=A0A124SCM1_CYNCS|nr:hypothetical protein Ccrd_003705 [Cynara cardunculus var. scolymus]